MSNTCDVSNEGGSNQYDTSAMELKVLGKTVRENYFLLFLSFVFTVIVVGVIIYVVFKIVETVRVYYRYYVRSDRAAYKDDDDEKYSEAEDGDDDGMMDEYSRIQSKIQSIENRYKSYNTEIGSYSRNVLNREPDDLINENILSRKHDDYDYTDDPKE